MFPQIRIADGFRLQSAEQLVTTGCAIIKGLSGNAAFPAPTVDLKTVQAAVDDLSAAEGSAGLLDITSTIPTERNAADTPRSAAAVESL